MKRHLALSGLLLCACFGCQTNLPHETALSENRAFTREMIAAVEARNLDQMMAHIWHSPDVIFMGPGGEVGRGWNQIRPVEQEFLASFASAHIEIEDEQYALAGDTVVALLTLKGAFTFPNGTVENARMRMSDVRRKEQDKWVTIFNHSHDLTVTDAPAGGDVE